MSNRVVHVVPRNDLREHVMLRTCWCKPRQDTQDDDLYIHNAMDQRETYEHGRKLS